MKPNGPEHSEDYQALNKQLMIEIAELKKKEAALRESKEKYRLIFSAESDAIFICDPATRQFFEVNDAACCLYGYSREEFLNLKAEDISADLEKTLSSIKKATHGQLASVGTRRMHKKKDGTLFSVDLSLNYLTWQNRKLICAIVRDVTEHVRAEEALRQSEEAGRRYQHHLTTLLDISNQLSGIDDDDDFCREAVTQCRERLGFERVGLWFYNQDDPHYLHGTFGTDEYGRTVDERSLRLPMYDQIKQILVREKNNAAKEPEQGQLLYQDIHSREYYVYWKSFSVEGMRLAVVFPDKQTFNITGEPLGNNTGVWAGVWDEENLIGVISIDNYLRHRPITDDDCRLLALFASTLGHLCSRRRIAQSLKESEEKYRQIFTTESDGILIVDLSTLKIVDVNEAACELYGYPREKFLDLKIDQISSEPEKTLAAFEKIVATDIIREIGYQSHKRKDGTTFPAEISYSTFTLRNRRLLCAIIRDITERTEAQKALRESQERLQTFLDNASAIICIKDAEGRYILINHQYEKTFHVSQKEIAGKTDLDLFPKEYAEIFRDNDQRVIKSGIPIEVEENALQDDGIHTYYSIKFPFFDSNNTPCAVGIISTDVTVRKRAEEALREREQQYRNLFNSSGDAILLLQTSDDRIVDANPRCIELLGYDLDELKTMTIWDLHPPEEQEKARSLKRLAFDQGRFLGAEDIHYVRRDGIPVPVSVSTTLFTWNSQVIALVQIRDVTERKQAEEQRKRLVHAIENAGEGIGIWDRNWCITYCNTALARMFGWEGSEDIIGRHWSSFFSGSEKYECEEAKRQIEHEGKWQCRCLGKCRDGAEIPLAVTLTRVGPSEGDYLVVGNIRDMSSEESYLKKIRQLTTDAEKSLENERSRIAQELHDEFGQILTALNITLTILKKQKPIDEAVIAERMDEAIMMVNQMTDGIRHLSKSLRPPLLDHQGFFDALKSYVADFSQRTQIQCRVKVESDHLLVKDPTATAAFRILQEALTNVARHARAANCVVSIKSDDSMMEMKILDNGKGASSEELSGKESLGVIGMQERAAALGGSVFIENSPKGGVCVVARLPLQ